MNLKEAQKFAGKFVDDMEAIQADIESGEPTLQAHALGVMAAIMIELAERVERFPGMKRMVAFMRSQAADMLAHKKSIEHDYLVAEFRRINDRWERNAGKRREARAQKWRDAGQDDMFG